MWFSMDKTSGYICSTETYFNRHSKQNRRHLDRSSSRHNQKPGTGPSVLQVPSQNIIPSAQYDKYKNCP